MKFPSGKVMQVLEALSCELQIRFPGGIIAQGDER